MSRILHLASRHGTFILPLGVLVGLAAQPLAGLMRPLLAPVVFLMLTFIFIRLDVLAAIAQVRRPKVVPLAVVLAVVVMPIITALFLMVFPQSPGLTAALILYTSSPPNFSAAALAFILGLDGALAVALILGALILHPILTPLFTEFVTGGAVQVPGLEIALRLALLIGGAALAAYIGRRLIGKARLARSGQAIDGVNVILMLVFVIGLMDGIPAQIIARPGHALALTALVFALHLGLNLATVLVFLWAGCAPPPPSASRSAAATSPPPWPSSAPPCRARPGCSSPCSSSRSISCRCCSSRSTAAGCGLVTHPTSLTRRNRSPPAPSWDATGRVRTKPPRFRPAPAHGRRPCPPRPRPAWPGS
jgi:bile acid:Na+ symporter, BASS family